MLKVHEEKCQVTDDINNTEALIELNTVKNINPVVPQDHIAGMHVSVALANISTVFSLEKKRVKPLMLFDAPCF